MDSAATSHDGPRVTHPSGLPRSRPLATVARWLIGASLGLAVAAVAAGGWHFSDMLIRPKPTRPLESDVVVAAVDDFTITLSASRVARRGHTWYLEWPRGSGVMGERIASHDSLVTRRFRVTAGALAAGDRVDLRAYPYLGDPLRAQGVRCEALVLATEPGDFPAWSVPGTR